MKRTFPYLLAGALSLFNGALYAGDDPLTGFSYTEIEPAVEDLLNPKDEVRWQAEAFMDQQKGRTLAPLLNMVQKGPEETRRKAAWALGRYGRHYSAKAINGQVLPALAGRFPLWRRNGPEGNWENVDPGDSYLPAQESSLTAIYHLFHANFATGKNSDAATRLIQLLGNDEKSKSDQKALGQSAAQTLGEMSSTVVADALGVALDKPEQVSPPLGDRDTFRCRVAEAIRRNYYGNRALPSLRTALGSGSKLLDHEVLKTLGQHGGPEDVFHIGPFLYDGDVWVSQAAASAFSSMTARDSNWGKVPLDLEAWAQVRVVLHDAIRTGPEDFHVSPRIQMVEALGRIKAPESIPFLRRIIRRHAVPTAKRDRHIAYFCARTLGELGETNVPDEASLPQR